MKVELDDTSLKQRGGAGRNQEFQQRDRQHNAKCRPDRREHCALGKRMPQ